MGLASAIPIFNNTFLFLIHSSQFLSLISLSLTPFSSPLSPFPLSTSSSSSSTPSYRSKSRLRKVCFDPIRSVRVREGSIAGMASLFLYHVVGDLTVGKPELVEFSEVETVAAAIRTIGDTSEGGIPVWRVRSQMVAVENAESRQQRFVGILNALDIVAFSV